MIEIYLFQMMFAVQILVLSILIPHRLMSRVRQQLARNPPDPRGAQAVRRTMGRYKVANIVIAVIGVGLMAGLFFYMHRTDWDNGPVGFAIAPYLVLQCLPLIVLNWFETRVSKMLKSTLADEKRKAVLQRRGLFDFVSPVVVVLTLLCYLLYVALVLYMQRDSFKGFFAGPNNEIAFVTVQYCVFAFIGYRIMYGRKSNPLQTHAERMNVIGTAVKSLVYSCLGAVLFLMTDFLLVLLNKQRLQPLVWSIYYVVIALWIYQSMKAPAEVSPLNELHGNAAH